MKNKEKYNKEIVKALNDNCEYLYRLVNQKKCDCSCKVCPMFNMGKWLNEEKCLYIIDPFEYEFLIRAKEYGLNWIARDGSDELSFYEVKPCKATSALDYWISNTGKAFIPPFKGMLEFINASDNEPYEIDHILKYYRVKED